MDEIIADLRIALPPVFLGVRIGELTGGAIHWPTIQNRRSRREIPDDCFAYTGQKVLVRRDPFLDWWATTLTTSRPKGGIARSTRKTGREAREAA